MARTNKRINIKVIISLILEILLTYIIKNTKNIPRKKHKQLQKYIFTYTTG
jgi:predicted permease